MSETKRHKSPRQRWEQALIDAYYDYRCHEVLDPLYDQFQRWKAGELTHDDMDQAIHEAQRKNQERSYAPVFHRSQLTSIRPTPAPLPSLPRTPDWR